MSPEGKGGGFAGLTTLPPSCAICLEILAASTSWSPKGLSGIPAAIRTLNRPVRN